MFNNLFFPENYALNEILWKDIIESDKLQVTIWRMRIAGWVPKATNANSEYVALIAFSLQQRLQERASMLRYSTLPGFSFSLLQKQI